MRARISDLADELKQVIRLAGRDPEKLEGALPALSGLQRVANAGQIDEPARVHLILHRVIPEYLARLPGGRDCRAIRELLTWEDEDGEPQSLTTRYHKAAAHLVNAADDFGRRQEPRLLLECARRFVALDHEDRIEVAPPTTHDARGAGAAEASATAPGRQPDDLAAGIAHVHKYLDYHLLVEHIAGAREIVLLNTWIPELNILADALVDALGRRASVSILMLYPDSDVARLRTQALQHSTHARFHEDRVNPGVRHCLEVLAAIARAVAPDARSRLRVRLYHSLPSIAVYRMDERAFVSVFVHGQLAVNSVQIEVDGRDTLMGQLVFRELQTLWEIGQEFEDLERWSAELEAMGQLLGTSP